MYNLSDVGKDFPWTKVVYNEIEPWRERETEEHAWFSDLPEGWGDITYDYLKKMDNVLKEYDLTDYLVIEQVKEKWGTGRFYYSFVPFYEKDNWKEWSNKQKDGIKKFDIYASAWETAVGRVCCMCGTTEDVQVFGGWVHYACPECEQKRIIRQRNEYREWLQSNGDYLEKLQESFGTDLGDD